MTDDSTEPIYQAHGFSFVNEFKPSAERALQGWCVELAHPPYTYNVLPLTVAARTDVSPLAKLLYADRLSFVRFARKANSTARKNGSPKEFTIPFVSWRKLAERLWCSVSKARAAAKQLESAGLMRVTPAQNSSHCCNRFEALFFNDPAVNGFEDAVGKIPENGSGWTEALLRHCYFVPVPVTCFNGGGPNTQLAAEIGTGFYARSVFVNMLVYAFMVKTANPCVFMGSSQIAKALGMHRTTVTRALATLIDRKLIAISASIERPVFAITEHPYMLSDDTQRETECRKLIEACSKEAVHAE